MQKANQNYLLEEISSPDVIPIIGNELIEVLLKNDNPVLPAHAARRLYLNDDSRGTDIFQKNINGTDPEIRRIYLLVFSEISDDFILNEFANTLELEPLSNLCLEFAKELQEIPNSGKIKSVITEELESIDPHRRWMAIQIARRIDTDWSREKLDSARRDEPDRALRRLIGMHANAV